VLTRTAESMGERDQRYTKQFAEFTTRLQMVADLEDLAQVRTSLMQRATELKNRVDQMAQDSNRSVAQLRQRSQPTKQGSRPWSSSRCGIP
jgi:hypothetical protein